MKFYYTLLVLLFMSFGGKAQDSASILFFGQEMDVAQMLKIRGENYSLEEVSMPRLFEHGKIHKYNTQVNDAEGNLLFFILEDHDGLKVYNRNRTLMKNGKFTSVKPLWEGNKNYWELNEFSNLIMSNRNYYAFDLHPKVIPLDGSGCRFLCLYFSGGNKRSVWGPGSTNYERNGLDYAVIDLSEPGGAVLEKDKTLIPDRQLPYEGSPIAQFLSLQVIPHVNGEDHWVVLFDHRSRFFAYHLSGNQIVDTKMTQFEYWFPLYVNYLPKEKKYLVGSVIGNWVYEDIDSLYNHVRYSLETYQFNNTNGSIEKESLIGRVHGSNFPIRSTSIGYHAYIQNIQYWFLNHTPKNDYVYGLLSRSDKRQRVIRVSLRDSNQDLYNAPYLLKFDQTGPVNLMSFLNNLWRNVFRSQFSLLIGGNIYFSYQQDFQNNFRDLQHMPHFSDEIEVIENADTENAQVAANPIKLKAGITVPFDGIDLLHLPPGRYHFCHVELLKEGCKDRWHFQPDLPQNYRDSAFHYIWRFGDGSVDTGYEVTHLYANEGVYEVGLEVMDTFGHLLSTTYDTIEIITTKPSLPIKDSIYLGNCGHRFELSAIDSQDLTRAYYSWQGDSLSGFSPQLLEVASGACDSLKWYYKREGWNCTDSLSLLLCSEAKDLSIEEKISLTEECEYEWNLQGDTLAEVAHFWVGTERKKGSKVLLTAMPSDRDTCLEISYVLTYEAGCKDSTQRTICSPVLDIPEVAPIKWVSVIDSQSIAVQFPEYEGIHRYEWERYSAEAGVWQSLSTQEGTLAIDEEVQPNRQTYRYRYRPEFGCEIPWSTASRSIHLRLKEDLEAALFEWNNYYYWEEGVDYYVLEKEDEVVLYRGEALVYHWEDTREVNPNSSYRVYAASPLSDKKSYSNRVYLKAEQLLWIPNAFSPNGDGVNDIFEVKGSRIAEIELKVYDRWGGLVYEGKGGADLSWDGSSREGKLLPSGVYLYQINITYTNQNRDYKSGTVHLMR